MATIKLTDKLIFEKVDQALNENEENFNFLKSVLTKENINEFSLDDRYLLMDIIVRFYNYNSKFGSIKDNFIELAKLFISLGIDCDKPQQGIIGKARPSLTYCCIGYISFELFQMIITKNTDFSKVNSNNRTYIDIINSSYYINNNKELYIKHLIDCKVPKEQLSDISDYELRSKMISYYKEKWESEPEPGSVQEPEPEQESDAKKLTFTYNDVIQMLNNIKYNYELLVFISNNINVNEFVHDDNDLIVIKLFISYCRNQIVENKEKYKNLMDIYMNKLTNINHTNKYNKNLLQCICFWIDTSGIYNDPIVYNWIKELISRGININHKDGYENTPLEKLVVQYHSETSIYKENFNLIKLFIDNGADIEPCQSYLSEDNWKLFKDYHDQIHSASKLNSKVEETAKFTMKFNEKTTISYKDEEGKIHTVNNITELYIY